MPNSGMLDHSALRTSNVQEEAACWMPAWPSRGLGYRTMSAMHQLSSFSRYNTAPSGRDSRRRPFSAPAELQGGAAKSALLPLTPFTTRLMTLGENAEEKRDLTSALWKSAAGQRRLKGPHRQSPFHTMQKPTCGYNFSQQTDHRVSKLGIPYVDLTRWQ